MYKRRRVNQDPREIRAKFSSRCSETGKVITKGERCIYYPASRSVFHLDSKQAQTFREWKQDIEELDQNY